jgi:hypothetical protein
MKNYKHVHKFYVKCLRVWKCITVDIAKNIRSILKASYVDSPPRLRDSYPSVRTPESCNSLPRTPDCIGCVECHRPIGLFAQFGCPQINGMWSTPDRQ